MSSQALSGQITVTTAGTAVQGTDVKVRLVYINALSGNTGAVYFGNDGAGDVTSANGFELAAGSTVLISCPSGNLNSLWFDAATDGDIFSWLIAE